MTEHKIWELSKNNNMYLSHFFKNPFIIFYLLCAYIVKSAKKGNDLILRSKYNISKNATVGDLKIIGKNFLLGDHSYFNSGYISTNENSKVQIGKWCAIGYNVSILAITHDTGIPTGIENQRPVKSGDVIIEDGVWIGNNVIITPGVHIGKQVVIGGNSVVTKDVPYFTVCSGNPCKVLYTKKEVTIIKHQDLIKF